MAEGARATWTQAVRLGAEGRYDESWMLLDSLAGTTLESLSLSTRGSHLRQIGAIDDARELDLRARSCAGDAESRADALIGLAADEVAAGRPAQAWLEQAEACAQDWRTQTRLLWVGAEAALLAGDAAAAVRTARRAVDRAEGHSSRHAAKGRIMVAAAEGAAGEQPTVDLAGVGQALRSYRLATLQWPLALVAADLAQVWPRHEPIDALLPQLVAEGAAAVRFIAEHLPVDRRSDWLDRPDLVRLTRP